MPLIYFTWSSPLGAILSIGARLANEFKRPYSSSLSNTLTVKLPKTSKQFNSGPATLLVRQRLISVQAGITTLTKVSTSCSLIVRSRDISLLSAAYFSNFLGSEKYTSKAKLKVLLPETPKQFNSGQISLPVLNTNTLHKNPSAISLQVTGAAYRRVVLPAKIAISATLQVRLGVIASHSWQNFSEYPFIRCSLRVKDPSTSSRQVNVGVSSLLVKKRVVPTLSSLTTLTKVATPCSLVVTNAVPSTQKYYSDFGSV